MGSDYISTNKCDRDALPLLPVIDQLESGPVTGTTGVGIILYRQLDPEQDSGKW